MIFDRLSPNNGSHENSMNWDTLWKIADYIMTLGRLNNLKKKFPESYVGKNLKVAIIMDYLHHNDSQKQVLGHWCFITEAVHNTLSWTTSSVLTFNFCSPPAALVVFISWLMGERGPSKKKMSGLVQLKYIFSANIAPV